MKWYFKFFQNKSIIFKLLTHYIIIILIIVSTLSIINSYNMTNELKDVFNKNTTQMIRQIKNNVEFNIKDIENIIYYLSVNEDVISYISGEQFNPSIESEKRVLELLKVYASGRLEIGGILIANQSGSFLSNDMVAISDKTMLEEDWYKKAISKPNKIQLFSKPINRNIKSIYDYYSADNMVSLVKAIQYDHNGVIETGVILIDLKINSIGSMISEKKFDENEFFYITDETHKVIFSPINKIVYRINSEWFNQSEDNDHTFVQEIGGHSYQIMYEYSEYINCNFVGVFSLDQSLRIINKVQRDILIYAFILLLIGVSIAAIYTNSIVKPIGVLQGLMKKAEEGELNIKFQVTNNDEIGKLGKSFNSMIESIKNLINIVQIEQNQKKEAELKAFQAQINPHFLYNTLDTINWMAQEYKADDISEVVCALTDLFRISLSKGKQIIPLRDEIKQVTSYLTIQLVRYNDKFTYSINCSEALLECKVVKLILQPIVENAIYHGIKQMDGMGHIEINIYEKDHNLIFSIMDDGVGIVESKVVALNEMLSSKEQQTSNYGIGIFNVSERIKLTYGDQYGIKIMSQEGKGTKVDVTQPLIYELG